MKKITILGSTGSIGTQTLDIVREHKDIRVKAVAARSNIDLLEKQIREFRPDIAAVWDEKKAAELKKRIKDTETKVLSGKSGLLAASVYEKSDLVVTALVGMIGIEPTMAAIRAGKDIALANKETLVCAGHLIMPLAERHHVSILPVDSEHSAVFQCLRGNKRNRIRRILLTASGGPFLNFTAEQLKKVKPEDAMKHPTWHMGRKVTIDSSTMVNKGLEVMEASWLFGVGTDRIEVVVQPQSIIHSMVEYEDGAVMAELGCPDMRLPIQYALYYPKRKPLSVEKLDFTKLSGIEIRRPDPERFPALSLAYEAGKTGGSLPTVFNAADEIAVEWFLDGKIPYTGISDLIAEAMDEHMKNGFLKNPSVGEIFAIRDDTEKFLKKKK